MRVLSVYMQLCRNDACALCVYASRLILIVFENNKTDRMFFNAVLLRVLWEEVFFYFVAVVQGG